MENTTLSLEPATPNGQLTLIARAVSTADPIQGLRITDLRTDFKTAEIVEQAIKIQETLGTMAAASFLKANGVDFGVTFRVLNRPWQRRNMSAD
jgi:hypothetical protein